MSDFLEDPVGALDPAEWWADPEAARRYAERLRKPAIAVLDTSCIRTGLEHQLKKGCLPASVSTAQDGTIHLYMEGETLQETWSKLPRFAGQLQVSVSDLERMLAEDWLPYIRVVDLPLALRELDERAGAVRDLDPDDYPAAALASLLSPCILLTHNHKDFRPLAIRGRGQGVDAVLAVIGIKTGENQLRAVVVLPAMPVVAVGAGAKWAANRAGPIVWGLLALVVVGGIVGYRRAPQETKDAIKRVAGGTGRFLLEEASKAAVGVEGARQLLDADLVPAPERRTPMGAILRELALTSDSMSAQQVWEALDDSVRPPVGPLRAFLHANKPGLFEEVRRGSFLLGHCNHFVSGLPGA